MNEYERKKLNEFNLEQGIIWILGEINETQMMNVMDLLNYYDDKSYTNIKMMIASPGGSKNCAFAIKDKIRLLQKKGIIVETYVVSSSASAATIISTSGTKGNRYIYPSASELIHSVSSTISGNIDDAENKMKSMRRAQLSVIKHYEETTNMNTEEIQKAIAFDNELDAAECLKLGLVDKILEGE